MALKVTLQSMTAEEALGDIEQLIKGYLDGKTSNLQTLVKIARVLLKYRLQP